jgi:hypothetical protein
MVGVTVRRERRFSGASPATALQSAPPIPARRDLRSRN